MMEHLDWNTTFPGSVADAASSTSGRLSVSF